MTETQTKNIANAVTNMREEAEMEALVSVIGTRQAQRAVKTHTLPELIASEQGHGMDHLNGALNRRAA